MNRYAWLATAVLIAAMGCATPLAVNYDYDTAADFTAMKTFNWMPPSGNAVSDDLLVKRIRNAVNTQLQTKGRTEATENPNFLIAMQLSGKTTYGGSTAVGASVGIPVGRAGTINVGGAKSKPHEKTEGTLVLDFLDAKTQALVWRATATAAVQPKGSPEEQQARINEVIATMLAQFPPKK
jgi:uncharacterized protein DUF4136